MNTLENTINEIIIFEKEESFDYENCNSILEVLQLRKEELLSYIEN